MVSSLRLLEGVFDLSLYAGSGITELGGGVESLLSPIPEEGGFPGEGVFSQSMHCTNDAGDWPSSVEMCVYIHTHARLCAHTPVWRGL